jgi:hypothetical protein
VGNYTKEPCSSTNVPTACICPMTRWLASWLRTGIPTRFAVARNLDKKVEGLLLEAAALANHT